MGKTQTEMKPVNLRLNRLVVSRLDILRDAPRAAGYHPSELHRMCPVYKYFEESARVGLASDDPRPHLEFLLRCLEAKTKKFPGRLKLEFAVGDAIHQMVQFHLGVNGLLWGRWKCPACGRVTKYGQMPRVIVTGLEGQPVPVGAGCNACGGQNRREEFSWLYLEPKVISEELGVTGNCDGDLRVVRGDVIYECILEIKSINEYGWTEGKRPPWTDIALQEGWTPPADWVPPYPSKPLPKEEHVLQASVYAHFKKKPWLYFIYVNKNQVNRWKEIMVAPDPMAIEDAKRKIQACNVGLEAKKPPLSDRACPDPREVEAKECPAFEQCWGHKPTPNLWDPGAKVNNG